MASRFESTSISYRYDALDRLASHGTGDDACGERFYCETRLVTELEGDECLSFIQHGDQLLAQLLRQNGGAACTLVSTDLAGSVLTALQANLKEFIAYSPFGYRFCGSGLVSLLGFNGQRPESVTGHYLLGNGYRAFNPVLMRFSSPDDLSPFDKGGFNAYAYCAGDPVNRTDSNGAFFAGIIKRFPKYNAARLSRQLGHKVKPVGRVVLNADDVFAFEDLKGQRLTVVGHGYTSGGKVALNGKPTNALDFYKFASANNIKMEKYRSIRTVICYSGNAITDSFGNTISAFGDDLSLVSRRPVKSYLGEVQASFVSDSLKELSNGQTYRGRYYFGVLKNKSIRGSGGPVLETNYQPVKFDNTVGGRRNWL